MLCQRYPDSSLRKAFACICQVICQVCQVKKERGDVTPRQAVVGRVNVALPGSKDGEGKGSDVAVLAGDQRQNGVKGHGLLVLVVDFH